MFQCIHLCWLGKFELLMARSNQGLNKTYWLMHINSNEAYECDNLGHLLKESEYRASLSKDQPDDSYLVNLDLIKT